MTDRPLAKGDRLVAYLNQRPAHRLFVEVVRLARDGSWADLHIQSAGTEWSKRQQLRTPFGYPPFCQLHDWTRDDRVAAIVDAQAKRTEAVEEVRA